MWIHPGDTFHVAVEHAGRREKGWLYFSRYDHYRCSFGQHAGECCTLHDPSFFAGDLNFLLTEYSPLQGDTYSHEGEPLPELLLTLSGYQLERYNDGPQSTMGGASVTFRYQSYTVSSLPVDEPLIIEHREQ